jgi:hypothetical protein
MVRLEGLGQLCNYSVFSILYMRRSQYKPVTEWSTMSWMTEVPFPSGGEVFVFTNVQTGAGAHSSSYTTRTRGLFPRGYSGRGVKLTNQLIVWRFRTFRTRGCIPQLPQTSSSPWFNYAEGQFYILSVTYEQANTYRELYYLRVYYLLSIWIHYKYMQLVSIIHSYLSIFYAQNYYGEVFRKSVNSKQPPSAS